VKKPFYYTFNLEGQDENKGAFFATPASAVLIKNMHFDEIGAFTARGIGYTSYVNTLSNNSIKGLGMHITNTLTPHMLIHHNTSLYTKNISTGTLSASVSGADTLTAKTQYFQLRDKTYILTSDYEPKVWDPTGGYAAATGWPVSDGVNSYSKPTRGCVYNNRAVFANFQGTTKYPSHIVISETLNPAGFTFTGTSTTRGVIFECGTGDGSAIEALVPIYNTDVGAENLLIFKTNSVWLLTGTTPDNMNVTKINNDYTCVGPNAAVQVGKDVYFISTGGIYTIGNNAESGTIQPTMDGSTKIKASFAQINIASASASWAQHLPWRKEVWFAIPTGSSTVPDTIFVLRYDQEQPIWTQRKDFNALVPIKYNNSLYTGGSDGKVQEWFLSNTYDGTNFEYEYKYDYFDFKDLAKNKRLRDLYLFLDTAVSGVVETKEQWQFDKGIKSWTTLPTLTVSAAAAYDTAVYDTAEYTDPTINFYKHKIPVRGNGQRLQLIFKGTTSVPCVFFGFTGVVELGGQSRNYN